MNNYKLTIQYDGTAYFGWQIQTNPNTIQGIITEKIELLLKEKINLIGSGRTDSGVHALGQIANFKTSVEIDIFKFRYSINSMLPKDISVIEICKEDEDFNARFDAIKRSYFYFITKNKSPFYNRYSFYHYSDLDISKLNSISKILIGKRDYSCFAKESFNIENTICNISFIHWKKIGNLILFCIEADRFLHGMVRSIVGTFIVLSKSNYEEKKLVEIINSQNRIYAGMSVPAKGLFLNKVWY